MFSAEFTETRQRNDGRMPLNSSVGIQLRRTASFSKETAHGTRSIALQPQVEFVVDDILVEHFVAKG
jgi:hypothetical protein